MIDFELEIFEQTSEYCEVRFRDGRDDSGGLRIRGLDRAAITELMEVVERTYAPDAIAPRVFDSTLLRDLGEKLYAFLDGDERWLSQALPDPRGVTLRILAEQGLRHLPWELMAKDNSYLAVSESTPVLPIRAASFPRHAGT